MSTVNRMMRAHDRMHGFFAKSEAGELSDFFTAQVERVEKQARCRYALCTLSTSRWLHLPAQPSLRWSAPNLCPWQARFCFMP
jgi:hypothetical protein